MYFDGAEVWILRGLLDHFYCSSRFLLLQVAPAFASMFILAGNLTNTGETFKISQIFPFFGLFFGSFYLNESAETTLPALKCCLMSQNIRTNACTSSCRRVDTREQNTGLTALTQDTRLLVFRCSGEDGSSGFRPVHLTDKLDLPGS